jgi:hypothetical protein
MAGRGFGNIFFQGLYFTEAEYQGGVNQFPLDFERIKKFEKITTHDEVNSLTLFEKIQYANWGRQKVIQKQQEWEKNKNKCIIL